MKDTNIIWIWRAVLFVLSVCLLAWLFWQNLVPSGILVLEHKKASPASPISDLHPEKRIIDLYDNNQIFYIDPVYFDAKVPREFDTVTVQIAWQNQSQPILELGARKVRGAWGFILKPLQNKIIDKLDWPCQRYNGVIFCQRVQKYSNLSEFFARPEGRVVSYNYVIPENIEHDIMNINTNIKDYDYLIATYDPPQSLGNDWYKNSVEFDWEDFSLYINEISFLISAPELNKGHGQIVVGDINITLKRDRLGWNGFWEYVKNQFKRLK